MNPGAFEIVGNSLDDDCDPGTSDVAPAPACSSSAIFGGVTAQTLAGAMELCQLTTASPPLADRVWGLVDAQFRLADGSVPGASALTDMTASQTAVLTAYGANVLPQAGATMAGLSNGTMRDPSDPGYVAPSPGTGHGSFGSPPASYLAAHGGSLPTGAGCEGSCPSGSGANDSVNLRLTIRVPTNAIAFSYRHRFFSAEFAGVCSNYNDTYLALLTSGASGIPADRNISFDVQSSAVSVNNLFWDVCTPKSCHTCPLGTADLLGTGLSATAGGGTGWLTTTAPVVPGETITLDLMVFDVSDDITDSNVLLDGFEWVAAVEIDTDGDGLVDGAEAILGTNSTLADTDGDGLEDGAEVLVHGTDPLRTDSDSDGFGDGVEVAAGSDPNDPSSTPPSIAVPALAPAQLVLMAGLLAGMGVWIGGRRRRAHAA